MSVITIVGITLGVLIAVCITWLGFPGTFLIAIVSMIWGWMTDFHSITVGVILVLFGISIFLEIKPMGRAHPGKLVGEKPALHLRWEMPTANAANA